MGGGRSRGGSERGREAAVLVGARFGRAASGVGGGGGVEAVAVFGGGGWGGASRKEVSWCAPVLTR